MTAHPDAHAVTDGHAIASDDKANQRPSTTRSEGHWSPTLAELPGILREDMAVHKGDRHMPGFRALAVYRLGAWAETQPRGFPRWFFRRVHRVLYRRIRALYGIELPATTLIGRRLLIPHSGPVVLHPYSRIGHGCMLRQSTTLGTNGPWRPDTAPTLHDRVELGVGSCVLGPVTVGEGALIGPGAVVFFDVPAGAKVVVAKPRVIPPADSAAPAQTPSS